MLVGIGICVLVLRAWSIQVIHGPSYTSLARSQAYRTVDLLGPRGPIVDAKGRLLADTTGQLVVVADVGALGAVDAHGVWSPTRAGGAAIRRISQLAHVPVRTLLTRIRRSVVRSPFKPAVVLPRPESSLASYLTERAPDYPGFKVTALPSRRYPQGGAFGSSFLGLLGEVGESQLATARYAHAKAGEIVGTSGVEASYDRLLNPGFIRARLRVDSRGRIAGALQTPSVRSLPKLQLTIDARVQRAAEKAVLDGMAFARLSGHHPTGGSAVVMNPWTGAVYALASEPTYNQVRAARDPAYLARLYRDPGDPLLNRAIAGVYPTGSTFKPIVAEAALSGGVITPSTPMLCSGSFNLGGFVFRNVEAGVYSTMTLTTALAQSCDTWFYRLGDRIYTADPARRGTLIQAWGRRLGLGRPTGIDLIGESSGLLPSPAWFLKTNHFPWTEGQTINLAIGQGALQVSPLQLAVAYSTLANGGTVVRPHLAAGVVHGEIVKPLRFPPARHLKLTDVWAIRQGLYEAAHSPGGTSASLFANFPVAVAGKTGTAESGAGRDDHSWYASWAPFGRPRVVVVVMIEHGGFGAQAAAPAAREIYQAFFELKRWKP